MERRGKNIVGKTDYDLSPAFLADQFRLDDEQVLAGARIVNRIELVSLADGQTCWHVTNKIPFLDHEGVIIGTAGMTHRINTSEINSSDGFGPVLAFIQNHYHEPISNRSLARLAGMSVRAFERKFQSSFHLTRRNTCENSACAWPVAA